MFNRPIGRLCEQFLLNVVSFYALCEKLIQSWTTKKQLITEVLENETEIGSNKTSYWVSIQLRFPTLIDCSYGRPL